MPEIVIPRASAGMQVDAARIERVSVEVIGKLLARDVAKLKWSFGWVIEGSSDSGVNLEIARFESSDRAFIVDYTRSKLKVIYIKIDSAPRQSDTCMKMTIRGEGDLRLTEP